MPCYNESETALETFGALTAIDYPDFEIIAVNDGSRDNTAEILDGLSEKIANLRVVHLAKNQGKATAMNVGALLARHELLVLIDGDALLDPYALRWVAWHFRIPTLGRLDRQSAHPQSHQHPGPAAGGRILLHHRADQARPGDLCAPVHGVGRDLRLPQARPERCGLVVTAHPDR